MNGRLTNEGAFASSISGGRRPMVAVLDIGAAKTTVVAGQMNDSGRLEILGFGESAGPLMQHGMLLNIDESVASVRMALEECRASNPSLRIQEVFVGVSGNPVRCLQTHCDAMRRNIHVEIHRDELDSLVSDQYKTPLPGGSSIIEVIPGCFSVDSLKNVPNPTGYVGAKLGADFHIVSVESDSLHGLKRCVERAGLKVAAWMLKPLSSACAVLCEDDLEAGVAVLDIGGGTTGLTVFYNGALQHVSVIPFGGENVTSDIKRGLGLLRRDAERMKRLHGFAIADKASDDACLSLPGSRGLPDRECGVEALSRIIQARMSEVLEFVNHNLAKAGIDRRLLNGGMVLTGGGSELKNLPPLTEYATGLNARIVHSDLHLEKGHPEKLAEPAYSTCVGLLLRGVGRNLGFPSRPQREPQNRLYRKAFLSETPPSKSPRKGIKILGVGGVGINVLSLLHARPIDGVGMAICDTDERALDGSELDMKLSLVSKQTCSRNQDPFEREFRDFLKDETGMLLVTAGMGGGTGTPSTPLLARLASKMGVPTVAIVATPFAFEGRGRARYAQEGIEEMKRHVDAWLVIDNRTLGRMNGDLTLKEAYRASQSAMASSAKCIIATLQSMGGLNPDGKDSRSNFAESGISFLGSASSNGADRARTALQKALEHPLSVGVVLKGAEWVWVHVESPDGEDDCLIGELDLIQSLILDITGTDTDVTMVQSRNFGPAGSLTITVLVPACSSHGTQTTHQVGGGLGMEYVSTTSPDPGNPASFPNQRSFKRLLTQDSGFVAGSHRAEVGTGHPSLPDTASFSVEEMHSQKTFTHPQPTCFDVGDATLSDPANRGTDLPGNPHSVGTPSLGMPDPSEAPLMPEGKVSRMPKDAEIWLRAGDLSPNLDTSRPCNEFDTVPAFIRRDLETDGSDSSKVEKYYSSISLLLDENGCRAHLSSLNSFLDGHKPD